MATFMLRHVDPVLWAAFTSKVAQQGQTPKAVLLKLIADYAQEATETRQNDR